MRAKSFARRLLRTKDRPRTIRVLERCDKILQEAISNITSLPARSIRNLNLDDPKRIIEEECKYPNVHTYTPQDWQDLYDREPIATRAVEVLPKECWQVHPVVYESESAYSVVKSQEISPFDEAWSAVLRMGRGTKSWYKGDKGSAIWNYLSRLDVSSGIGQFGVALLGFNDGLDPRYPVKGVEEINTFPESTDPDQQAGGDTPGSPNPRYQSGSVESPSPSSSRYTPNSQTHNYKLTVNKEASQGRKLLYMRVFPESQVQVTQWESNRTSPRYGQPVMYMITLNQMGENYTGIGLPIATINVHWTRIIHVAESISGGNESIGTSRMRHIIRPLLDIEKVRGGSAEMYWKGALMGLSIETVPNLGEADPQIDEDELRDMIERFQRRLQRYISLVNMTAKPLSPQVVDPTPQIAAYIEAICILIGCPVRIFKGSERGELASTQDDDAWNDRLKYRQDNHITPCIICAFVDRLIMVGVLPEPEKGYTVDWPDLTSRSDQEKATVGMSRAQALSLYTSGTLNALMSPLDFLIYCLGISEEEAQSILVNADLFQKAEEAGLTVEEYLVQFPEEAPLEEEETIDPDSNGEASETAPDTEEEQEDEDDEKETEPDGS